MDYVGDLKDSLSLWERVRVRAESSPKLRTLSQALSQREREQTKDDSPKISCATSSLRG